MQGWSPGLSHGSLYASWDDSFYREGVGAWMARFDADTDGRGMNIDARFFPHDDDFRGMCVHQTRLRGGYMSTSSTGSSSGQ